LKFHELRHTFVALWIAAGANPKEISVRAGHSSVAFTLDRYGHLYEDAEDQIPDRLDALLFSRDAHQARTRTVIEMKRGDRDVL
jgi:integrase